MPDKYYIYADFLSYCNHRVEISVYATVKCRQHGRRSPEGPSQPPSWNGTACTCDAGGRARRSKTHRTACTRVAGGRARRSKIHRTACTEIAGGRARTSSERIHSPCTWIAGDRARRSQHRGTLCSSTRSGICRTRTSHSTSASALASLYVSAEQRCNLPGKVLKWIKMAPL